MFSPLVIVELTMASLFAILLAGLFSTYVQSRSDVWPKILMISCILWLLIDAVSYILAETNLPFFLRYASGLISYCAGCVVIIISLQFRESYIGEKTVINPWLYRIPKLILLIGTIAISIEYASGSIDIYENEVLIGTNGIPPYIAAVQVLILLYCPIIAYSKRKVLGGKTVLLFALFDFVPILAIIIIMFIETDISVVLCSLDTFLIVILLQRDQKEAQSELIASQEELARQYSRFFALEDSFESLYDVELETGRYVTYVKGTFFQNNVLDKLLKPGDYFEDLRRNIDKVIYEEDREPLFKILTRDAIRAELAENEHFDHFYRINGESGPAWFKLRIVYSNSSHTNVIIGVFDAREEMAAQERNNRLIATFASENEVSLSFNLKTGVIAPLVASGVNGKRTEEMLNDVDTITKYVDNFVYPDDRHFFSGELFSPEGARQKIPVGESVSFEYRGIREGDYCWYNAILTRITEDEVIIGYRNCDNEILHRRISETLIADFASVFIVNLIKGTYRCISRNSESAFPDAPSGNYSEVVKEYAYKVNPSYREYWNSVCDVDSVRSMLMKQNRLEYVYPLENCEKKWRRCLIQTLESEKGVPTSFIMTCFILDDRRAETLELMAEIAEQKARLEEEKHHTDLLHDIIHSGKWSFFVSEADEIIGSNVSDEANRIINNDIPADGHSWLEIVHPDDREAAEAAFNATIKDHSCNTPYDVNYRMIDRNGEYHWFHSAGRVFRDEDGNGEFFGVHIDITEEINEQNRRDYEAEESRKLIESVAAAYDVAYAVNMKDDTFRLLKNVGGLLDDSEDFKSYSESKESLLTIIHKDDRNMMRHELEYDTIREKLVPKKPYTVGFRVLNDGKTEWHEMKVTPIDDDNVALGFAEKDVELTKLHLEEMRYDEYFALFVVDLGTGMLKIVKNEEYYQPAPIGTSVPYVAFMRDLAQNLEEEPREFFMQIADLDFARQEFAQDDKRTYSYQSKLASNENKWVDLTAYVIMRNEDGSPSMFTLGFSYVDALAAARLEAQKELVAARIAADAANKAKTDFLFNMSHDIRTPMNAIIGFTGMAIKHIDKKEKVLDYLIKTQKAGSLLLSLINSVLEVSRIESGHANLDQQFGDVYFSFANIENTMYDLAATKDIHITFEYGDIENRYVFADFSRCMRIFVNVISNAIKYTPEGGTVRVRCEQLCEPSDGVATYRYTISDNGIGMSEEFQKHIFEQFTRENSATVSGIQGSGLGMTVVKSFVDLLGGNISFTSKQGEGTTFIIDLPFVLQEGELYTDPVTGDVISPGNTRVLLEKQFFKGKHILLVDDNDFNREIAIEILEDEGIIVEWADDGTRAVDIVKEKGPDYFDFVLMDIQMPVMNGYDATREIRKLFPDSSLPIVALSANAFSEDREKSLEAGMNDHIAKPIKIDELFSVISKYIRQ